MLTIDEKLQRYHDLQIELDKRKQLLNKLTQEFPQISLQIDQPTQQIIGQIDRMKIKIHRKQEVRRCLTKIYLFF